MTLLKERSESQKVLRSQALDDWTLFFFFFFFFFFSHFHPFGDPYDMFMSIYSPRASNRFNQVVEANRFEGVFLCKKVC